MDKGKKKLTQRNPHTGAIEWTKHADEVMKKVPDYIGDLARLLIYLHENPLEEDRKGYGNDR